MADKWRALLAVLLVSANRTVSVDRLLFELYGDKPPGSAAKLIQVYVSKLRRALGDANGAVLTTRPTGYSLVVEPKEIDAGRFERLAAEGRQALHAAAPESAVDRLESALALWRGPAFADVPRSAAIEAASVRLEELRLQTREEWADAHLALGHYAEMVGELRTAVFEHPLREKLRGQLMLALAGAGRRGEAIAEYVAGRQLLMDELGVEPGADMRAAHAAILSSAACEDGDARPPTSQPPRARYGGDHTLAVRGPRQLPRGMPDFVGRDQEARRVRELLVATDNAGPPVAVITGLPGVGKSTLAIQVAHGLWPAFPDGQLYVDLSPDRDRPAGSAEVLAGLLGSLGYPASHLPPDASQRAAIWRATLVDRKVLLLLDNAVDERQVRPLIPGAAGSAVLVTSRSRLAGLEAVQRLALPELSVDAAVELLSHIIGSARIASERTAATEIAVLCGCLPLAVRIAGARLAANPDWTLERCAAMLRPAERRLDLLVAGDLSLRDAIGLSQSSLDDTAAQALRHLALLDVAGVPGWACSPLVDLPEGASPGVTDQLVERNLLMPVPSRVTEPVRYRLRAARGSGDRVGSAALLRQLGELHTVQDRYPNAIDSFDEALDAIGGTGDRGAEAAVHSGLGYVSRLQGRYEVALQHLTRGAKLATMDERWSAAAYAKTQIGVVHLETGLRRSARRYLREALVLAQRSGHGPGMATVLRCLGLAELASGRLAQAEPYFNASVATCAAMGDRNSENHGRHWLGHTATLLGDLRQATDILHECLDRYQGVGQLFGEAITLRSLGIVDLRAGRVDAALARVRDAMGIWDRIGSPYWTAQTLDTLADLYARRDDHRAAAGCAGRAARLRTSIGTPLTSRG